MGLKVERYWLPELKKETIDILLNRFCYLPITKLDKKNTKLYKITRCRDNSTQPNQISALVIRKRFLRSSVFEGFIVGQYITTYSEFPND